MPVLLFPQGPTPQVIDLASVLSDILPALGATSFTDLHWSSETELYDWADEAASRLARCAGVWVTRSAPQMVAANANTAPTPADLIDAIQVTVNGASLRPVTTLDLSALDSQWPIAYGIPMRFSMDAAPGSVFVYQAPTAQATLAIIYHQRQPTITLGASVVPIASPVQDYFGYSILEQARRKESDQAMPEMADHFAQRVGLYEQIFEHYWGPAQ